MSVIDCKEPKSSNVFVDVTWHLPFRSLILGYGLAAMPLCVAATPSGHLPLLSPAFLDAQAGAQLAQQPHSTRKLLPTCTCNASILRTASQRAQVRRGMKLNAETEATLFNIKGMQRLVSSNTCVSQNCKN